MARIVEVHLPRADLLDSGQQTYGVGSEWLQTRHSVVTDT